MINCVINGKEILIPEVEEWITAIDLDLKVISLELPEGLLEL
jgi:ribosomal 30S subunit maturation factor RimM